VHCQNTVNERCTATTLRSAKRFKAVHRRVLYQDTPPCKRIEDSATWYRKIVHGDATTKTVLLAKTIEESAMWYKRQCMGGALPGYQAVQNERSPWNMVQKGCARVVHYQDTVPCKTVKGSAIQESATWFRMTVHGCCTIRTQRRANRSKAVKRRHERSAKNHQNL
jgi:hypothetical protein